MSTVLSKNVSKLKAIIAPSMLSCDFSKMGLECERMIKSGADWLHMDVMDGHFVPNLTIGAPIIKWLHSHYPKVFFDCHLMVSEPLKWIHDFSVSGATQYTFHWESTNDPLKVLNCILENKMKAGIAIKPKTQLLDSNGNPTNLFNFLLKNESKINNILVMTVEPGFGGQSFMEDQMEKVTLLRNKFQNTNIQVDGGLNVKNIQIAAKAGANVIVAGTGIFKYPNSENPNPTEAIAILRKSVESNIQ